MKRGVKPTKPTSGSIRIISGKWRGTKLPVTDVNGLRPTTDRNKETLFNWLMPFMTDATCLDVFAGSGGLGFEALSRYAKSVLMFELDKKAYQQLQLNLRKLQVTSEQGKVMQGDALIHLTSLSEPFDIVFIDPPFHQNLVPRTIESLNEHKLIAQNGLIYIECELQNASYLVPQSWHLLKQLQTSQVSARLYQHA
jgi:16S rRNA (guanine966-N2)-methyltransferase